MATAKPIITRIFQATHGESQLCDPGALDYGKDLGKKGTVERSYLLQPQKGENTVTFIEPTRYPERLVPLFDAVSMAKKALIIVDQIHSAFGESVIMLDCEGLKDGIVVLRNYLSREQIAPLIKGTVVDGYEFMEDDKNALRERFLDDVAKIGTIIASERGPCLWTTSSMCGASELLFWGPWPKAPLKSTMS